MKNVLPCATGAVSLRLAEARGCADLIVASSGRLSLAGAPSSSIDRTTPGGTTTTLDCAGGRLNLAGAPSYSIDRTQPRPDTSTTLACQPGLVRIRLEVIGLVDTVYGHPGALRIVGAPITLTSTASSASTTLACTGGTLGLAGKPVDLRYKRKGPKNNKR